MLRPRTRLISLRMTQEEHEQLRQASLRQGARSVSDFVRAVLLRTDRLGRTSDMESGNPQCACSAIASLDRRLSRVETDLARISDGFQTVPSATPGQ